MKLRRQCVGLVALLVSAALPPGAGAQDRVSPCSGAPAYEDRNSMLFLGQPGCGKTHLAVALAIKVVEAGWRGYFTTADDMTRTLTRAQIEGNWAVKLRTYTAPTVLVIDDVGLLPIHDRDAAGAFFHV